VSALALLVAAVGLVANPMRANADPVVYLNSINARPGYNFPNTEAALSYGRAVCDKVAAGRSYAQITGEVEADLNTSNEYQANYLIGQAINELCPELISQLRDSAANYRPAAQ
jgi:hypothetical protein